VLLDEQNPENSTCVRCDRFDGFPCLLDGKADAHVLCVRPSLQYKNVTLKIGRKVERLVEDAGAVSEVVAVNQANGRGALFGRPRRRVVRRGELGGPAAQVEVANSSGVVGRHYMAHQNSALLAISKEPNPTKFQKDARPERLLRALGRLRLPARSHPDARQVRRRGAQGRRAAVHAEVHARLRRQARGRFLADVRRPPEPRQPRDVERNGQIRLAYRDNNLEGHKRLLKKLHGLLHHLACTRT
jgi:hypothetical protein